MGIKFTISVLAYECHDRNLSSCLLGKMGIERKQQQRQEKLEKMEIAVSQSSCAEMSDCNATNYHTPASLSLHSCSYPWGTFFSNMG